MTRKLSFVLLALTLTLGAGAATALAATSREANDPGVTPSSILLGATASRTGSASSYASIARGARAYFEYVNSLGGVNGRRIDYTVLDDASDPAQSLELTRGLVEDSGVFALFGTFGVEQNLAIRDYLNQKGVPQLFAASGATALGRDAADYPYTIGLQPSYAAEGWVLGQYVGRTQGTARIGVVYEDDVYGQELLAGLKRGIQRSNAKVVSALPYDPGAADVEAQVARLRISGANVFAVFASPRLTGEALRYAKKLGWRPKLTLDGSASTSASVVAAATRGASKVTKSLVSVAFLKEPTDPRWKNDEDMKQYRRLMKRFAPTADTDDVYHVYGMAAAWTAVEAIRKAGPNLTRDRLVEVVSSLALPKNPFLLPGIVLKTGEGDHFPIEQLLLQRWQKGAWKSFGGIWAYRGP